MVLRSGSENDASIRDAALVKMYSSKSCVFIGLVSLMLHHFWFHKLTEASYRSSLGGI